MADLGIRLGVSPLSWVNEVLADFGAGTSAETVVSEARDAGFEGAELSRVFPREPDRLASLLSRYGLSLVSGWHSGFLADRTVREEILAVRDHANLLKSCGAEVMVYGECGRMPDNALDLPMSRRGRLSASEWANYGRRLSDFADWLEGEYGLLLAYHHHLMMVAETFEETTAILDAAPRARLLLDTGHAAAAGFDHVRLIDRFGDRIAHIHLKDVRSNIMAQVRSGDLSFNDGVRAGMFSIPSDGDVDFAPLARFLASGRYKGWVLVEAEQNPAIALPATTVKRAFAFVSSSLLPATVV